MALTRVIVSWGSFPHLGSIDFDTGRCDFPLKLKNEALEIGKWACPSVSRRWSAHPATPVEDDNPPSSSAVELQKVVDIGADSKKLYKDSTSLPSGCC